MNRESGIDKSVSFDDRLLGCLAGGAMGDAVGSCYEGKAVVGAISFEALSGITDDTQLTLATCEAILLAQKVSPEGIAAKMLEWFNKGKVQGLGSSTLKALRDLQVGAHWALSGRSGEYAAGNGAAMRIAPLAFFVDLEMERTLVRDVCNITHKNDEAYVGCLAILYALQAIINGQWRTGANLPALITDYLPDTGVRDNLLQLKEHPACSIAEAARITGTSGHVIESVPFSIFAAQQIRERSFEDVISDIILCGGDTDTNASLAGNIMGTFLGIAGFSSYSLATFRSIKESDYILNIGKELAGAVIL